MYGVIQKHKQKWKIIKNGTKKLEYHFRSWLRHKSNPKNETFLEFLYTSIVIQKFEKFSRCT